MISLYEMSRTGKFMEIEGRLVAAKGKGEGIAGSDHLTDAGFPFGKMKLFCKDIVVMVAKYYECT